VAFDAAGFVNECRAAVVDVDPVTAVWGVVAAAIADGTSIDAVLGTEFKRAPDILFSSVELTVQRIRWPPGFVSSPHDHRLWAVIGVYNGEELNRLYNRSSDGLKECGRRILPQRGVLVLDAAAIHSVENPARVWTAGLHVYGGDILSVERSAWGPDGREVPFAEDLSARIAMFQAIRDLATDREKHIDDEAGFLAFTALKAACERERRYPTPPQARRIIAEAWQLAP
jgi:predicted metal-dependent enzyme (double-stranded beta helix superfamily)